MGWCTAMAGPSEAGAAPADRRSRAWAGRCGGQDGRSADHAPYAPDPDFRARLLPRPARRSACLRTRRRRRWIGRRRCQRQRGWRREQQHGWGGRSRRQPVHGARCNAGCLPARHIDARQRRGRRRRPGRRPSGRRPSRPAWPDGHFSRAHGAQSPRPDRVPDSGIRGGPAASAGRAAAPGSQRHLARAHAWHSGTGAGGGWGADTPLRNAPPRVSARAPRRGSRRHR